MAISDIKNLRANFPDHFENKDLKNSPDYLRIPVDEPNPIPFPKEERREYAEGFDPSEIIDRELAEWDPSEDPPSVPLGPEAQEIFGGHPGGLQDDSEDRLSGVSSTTNIDILAFYLPFHLFQDWWGIYITPEGILRIRKEMQPFFRRHNIQPIEQVRLAKQLLYHHEYYHHAVESFATRLEAIQNYPCFLKGFIPQYKKTFGTSGCLEETCANSYSREKLLRNCKTLGVPRRDLVSTINDWFAGQPAGYNEARLTNGSWTRTLRPLLYENYVDACSKQGVGGARSPLSRYTAVSAWSAAGHLDRGIGDVKSRISYIIPKGSPLYKRLPADARTCIKGGSFKRRLKRLGVAKLYRQGSGHEIWESILTGHRTSIPRHDSKDIPKGTMRAILRQLGSTMGLDEFLSA